jgi:hypothetical protein
VIDDVTTALARAHRDDLQREAARARLARLATCCQPSAVASMGTKLVARFRGQSQACDC